MTVDTRLHRPTVLDPAPPARGGSCIGTVLIGMALFYGPPIAWWLWSMIDAINAAQTMLVPW